MYPAFRNCNQVQMKPQSMFCSSAPYTKKHGHSTGPKEPRLQKSPGVSKRTCCRQPTSSIPLSYNLRTTLEHRGRRSRRGRNLDWARVIAKRCICFMYCKNSKCLRSKHIKGSKGRYLLRQNQQIFGLIPFVKLQNNSETMENEVKN